MKEQIKHKTEARFGLSMPKNPYNNLMFDHIGGFEFFLIFRVQILSYLPLFQKGTTAEFPALGHSHNRPWLFPVDKFSNLHYKPHSELHGIL